MKKFVCLILMMLLFQPSYAAVTDSNNAFEIELREAPPGGGGGGTHHDGLSDGAVTAITLGSVFGGLGLLGGVGYYFFKHSPGLACGFACGEKCPYHLVGLENPEIITKSEYTYLIKAYENLKKEEGQKYLLIPDTEIKLNTYNTAFFELPDELKNSEFQIVQASDSFALSKQMPELDTDIFLNPENKNALKISTSSVKINPENGILIKKGKVINQGNKILALTTTYKPVNKFKKASTYAVIVCFNKDTK